MMIVVDLGEQHERTPCNNLLHIPIFATSHFETAPVYPLEHMNNIHLLIAKVAFWAPTEVELPYVDLVSVGHTPDSSANHRLRGLRRDLRDDFAHRARDKLAGTRDAGTRALLAHWLAATHNADANVDTNMCNAEDCSRCNGETDTENSMSSPAKWTRSMSQLAVPANT